METNIANTFYSEDDGVYVTSYVEEGEPYIQCTYEDGNIVRFAAHTEEEQAEIDEMCRKIDLQQAEDNAKAQAIYWKHQSGQAETNGFLFLPAILALVGLVLGLVALIGG